MYSKCSISKFKTLSILLTWGIKDGTLEIIKEYKNKA